MVGGGDEEGEEDGLGSAWLEDEPYFNMAVLQEDVLAAHEGLLSFNQRQLLEEWLKTECINADVCKVNLWLISRLIGQAIIAAVAKVFKLDTRGNWGYSELVSLGGKTKLLLVVDESGLFPAATYGRHNFVYFLFPARRGLDDLEVEVGRVKACGGAADGLLKKLHHL